MILLEALLEPIEAFENFVFLGTSSTLGRKIGAK